MPFLLGIEGYFKTGKTTLGRKLAKKYNAPLIDVGVLYRIVSSLLLNKHMPIEQIKKLVNTKDIETIMKDLNIYYDYSLMSFSQMPNDIYSIEVSEVSTIIGEITGDKWYPFFYSLINEIKKTTDVILVGRNVLKVFPNVDIHFFLVANTQKIVELTLKEQPSLTYEEAFDIVQKREEREKNIRKYSCKNDSTIQIDISDKNEEEVFNLVVYYIESKR